jgi:hypothetical protein
MIWYGSLCYYFGADKYKYQFILWDRVRKFKEEKDYSDFHVLYHLGRAAFYNVPVDFEKDDNLKLVIELYWKWISNVQKVIWLFMAGARNELGKDVSLKIAKLVWNSRTENIWYQAIKEREVEPPPAMVVEYNFPDSDTEEDLDPFG